MVMLPLKALGQSDTVSIVAYWAKGEVFKYQVNKSTKVWRDGQLTQQKISNYQARFEVLDSTATYYRIKWTYELDPRKFFNMPIKAQSLMDKVGKMKVIYKTSELGEFRKAENWQEVYKLLLAMSEDIIQLYENKWSDAQKTALKIRLKSFLTAYNSPEGIASLLLKELQLLHFAFGGAFVGSQRVEYEEQLPNMMGGKPLKADVKLWMSKVDTITQQCVLRRQMHINPTSAKAFLLEVLQKMGATEDKLNEELGKAKFDINDNNYLEYNYVFGVPIKTSTHRVAHIRLDASKNRREDKVMIQLIKD
ncbi:MAG TPA: hypothetical protein DCS93_37540 [Microscillaceae bacterium]|nr:hypothetical protein [Microscillaceae bacterium]